MIVEEIRQEIKETKELWKATGHKTLEEQKRLKELEQALKGGKLK